MEDQGFQIFLEIAFTLALILCGYVVGQRRERRHLRELDRREAELVGMPAVPMAKIAGGELPERIALVEGSVVVSIDYFKRVLSSVLQIFGGRIDAYAVVVQRARREALLRMKEDAQARGLNAVVCVRLETSRLASSGRNGKGTAGIEVHAFGTGISMAHQVQSTEVRPQEVALVGGTTA